MTTIMSVSDLFLFTLHHIVICDYLFIYIYLYIKRLFSRQLDGVPVSSTRHLIPAPRARTSSRIDYTAGQCVCVCLRRCVSSSSDTENVALVVFICLFAGCQRKSERNSVAGTT